ncbi:MAG: YqjF family protein [Gemmataceae bacterium]
MSRPFLTAEWRNLFLATYAVPPSLLQPRLPAGLELDTRDGNAFVSLVAFQFLNTRVLGVPWPGYRNFPELNLRFYVRHGGDRGVIFVREIVSERLVAWLARTIYNEPYRVAPLTSHCQEDDAGRTMEYRLMWGKCEQMLRVSGRKPAYLPAQDSDEHFFKEHHWGYGRTRRGHALRYEVAHPPWEVLPVPSYHIDMDWGSVYGREWEFLSKATPMSTVFALGSAIAVYPKGTLLSHSR